MACYRPLRGYQAQAGGPIFFHESAKQQAVRSLDLPCGQCIGCRLERSRQWGVRVMHEARLHDYNSFVTLTYDDAGLSLEYRDFQRFMRRLRKTGRKVRFFMCGEYGELNRRPHFHAILFNCHFGDRREWSKASDGSTLYRSAELERLWTHGFSSIGNVSMASAMYVARYCVGKVTGDLAADHYRVVDPTTGELVDRVPEFGQMSRRPGIGAEYFDRWYREWYQGEGGREGVVVVDGVPQKAPKYYDRRFGELDAEALEQVKYKREVQGRKRSADNTNERLVVREEVQLARANFLKRSI